MKNDFARRNSVSDAKKQHSEDMAEKRVQLFARKVMPALEEGSPQLMQTATSMGKSCCQAIM
jgi:hypothetical protein